MSWNESLSANSNYPPMSQSDWDNAPFNEPLEEDFTRTVSVSISFDYTTSLTADCTEEEIKEAISDRVWNMIKNNKELKQLEDFGIDEVEVLDE